MKSAESKAEEAVLLAVDAGLRSGLAWFAEDGRVLGYRSTNFGSLHRLKKAVPGILAEFPSLEYLVVEGPRPFDHIWTKIGEKKDLYCRVVPVDTWRKAVLSPGEQRSGCKAKLSAQEKAREIIRQAGAALPTSLNHDAAEAVLIGLWAVGVYLERGEE